MAKDTYTTHQVADMAGVHRDTLLRWLREGRIPEPGRDRNNWRAFSREEADAVVRFAKGISESNLAKVAERQASYVTGGAYSQSVPRLSLLDWDFVDANTGFLTHSIHPYPAKFIPQIPNTLIQELSSIGDTVLDPFCGSGTMSVEALRLGRHAIGLDANPLSCLISKVKTTKISQSEADELLGLADEIKDLGQQTSLGNLPLFPDMPSFTAATRPTFRGVEDWFDEHVIDELAFVKKKCRSLTQENARQLALVAMSSIIVTVSRQDSDTRYVRRDKNTQLGDTFSRFSRALLDTTQKALEFAREVDSRWNVQIIEANILDQPDIGSVDLVVCSPPYPNAYSYHLYHRTRMLWLDMNQPDFKKIEIGSHRKYSRKGSNGATVETFRGELDTIFAWLARQLRPKRHACFVIGDSVIKGEKVKNDELLIKVAKKHGFVLEANIKRNLQATRKSFNPKIGKIRDEHIVILRNAGGEL
ncbi:MerR family DNA-binding transcriptional regulator [bacterium]|nr:MerR family DNA-binding transcriptional regulator [bacterium]MBL7162285.1 MerR family DNA-binding transcriptional regulator [Anaerolineales bacterium]